MNEIYEFDLANCLPDNRFYDLSKKYGKLNGYLLANEFDLATSKKGFLVFNELMDFSFFNKNKNEIFLCRTDAPLGYGNLLPRGRDLKCHEINSFLNELKSINRDSILICYRHPSIELTGSYIPRYKTQGAIIVVFNKNVNISVEYVGPGFDVGDLTRGKSVHASIAIPWDEINNDPRELFKFAKRNVFYYYEISSNNYALDRSARINELISKLGELYFDEIHNSIPLEKSLLSMDMFSRIYSSIINKILSNCFTGLGNHFGVLINIYKSHLYVFEIWKTERSNNK